MSTEDIDRLFAETILGDYDDDAPWTAVHALRRLGTREVFGLAAEFCDSSDALKRARGLDVLAQLGKTSDHPTNNFPEEAYSLVSEKVRRETEVLPLDAGIAALGHLDNPLAIPLIARFRNHPHARVRYSVTFALACFPNDPKSIDSLLPLTTDADEDVRDWATFGLGSLSDHDSSEIRGALLQRLSDPNNNVREEAMSGLGKRRDLRVLPELIGTLENPPVSDCVIEAAYQILGMDSDREDWGTSEYASALRERFTA